jgi:hypothetical protein
MADWTNPYPTPGDPPPGAIAPPAPDQVQPTDPGWSQFVRNETDKTGLKWSPDCAVSLEVVATGVTNDWPLDGDNPDDYSADKDWGWKEDRTYETQPPEPYQDFTRWVRHYPRVRMQHFVQYKAIVYVRCGAHFVNRPPVYFWKADGPPTTGAHDAYFWTTTSGMKTDEYGKSFKWTTTGKKTPPPVQDPRPDGSWFGPHETPPPWIVHPIEWHPKIDWHWKPRYDWLEPRSLPVGPGKQIRFWFRAGDVFKPGSRPATRQKRRRRLG